MWDEGATYYNSPIGALIVNHSCIDIWVRPNTKIGQAPTIYVRPITDYVKILSDATVSEEENIKKIERRWMNHENTIDITGKIPSTFDPFYTAVPVEAPHLYTANILKDILKKNAISLTGQIRIKTVPEQAVILACTSSRPLCKIVEEMMKESDNLIADMLFKKMGQVRFGAPGTWQKGSRAVREFLKNDVGIDIERIVIMDGSGLSRYNQLSPHHLIEALLWMKKQFACSSEFCASLPISGTDGTLIQRMCESHLKGKIRAKTGTMRGVSSLSGYITTSTGEELVFSILLNGFTKKNTEYKAQIEDRICAILVN